MADAQQLVFSNGPLPIKQSFNAPADGPVIFFLSGSAWASGNNELVGLTLTLDGALLGNALVFCNEANSHRAVPAILVPATLTSGSHLLEIAKFNSNTSTDQNDYYMVTLLY